MAYICSNGSQRRDVVIRRLRKWKAVSMACRLVMKSVIDTELSAIVAWPAYLHVLYDGIVVYYNDGISNADDLATLPALDIVYRSILM